uniref:Glucosylceramidase n=1 Tax=Globodera pallida TaxID=36090 RepID=A0A183CPH1_GLOPA
MQKLAFKLLLSILIIHQCLAEWKPCKKRKFDQDSFVCVCSAEHCDSPEAIGDLNDSHKLVYYVSDPADKRLARFELAPNDAAANAKGIVEVRVDASQKRHWLHNWPNADRQL